MVGKCSATNKDGTPCSGQHFRDGFCRWHHPDLAEQQSAWRVKGGKARSNRARLKKQLPEGAMTPSEIHAMLCIVFKNTLTGRIEPSVATAMASVSRAIREMAGAAEIEERIAELERLAGRRSA